MTSERDIFPSSIQPWSLHYEDKNEGKIKSYSKFLNFCLDQRIHLTCHKQVEENISEVKEKQYKFSHTHT